MSFTDVLGRMLVLFFGIAVGFFANRKGILGGVVDQRLSKLLLNITLPCMIVGTVISGETLPELAEMLSVLWVSVVFYGMEFVLLLVVPRLLGGEPGEKGVWRYTLAFPNVGFIGNPVVVALFGPEALFYSVILALPFNMLAYTLGPLMLVGAKRFSWKQLTSPCIIASVIALALTLGRIHLPAVVGETLNFMGDITVPLSLLVVGSLLANMPARQVFTSRRLWALSAIRLLVMPAMLWGILRGMPIAPMIFGVAVMHMSMPTAVNGTMLSMEYGGDTECMAQATFLTTLLSIATIPLMAAILL